mmetsp:Transcript_31338/g.82406  ORF Transcript_31338/g.82406 Transcript_31338/m.82406 type:complete len:297 (-) Transcript_31338:52-942(-)
MLMPNMKKTIPKIISAQHSDLKEPSRAKIIMRSSRKKRMIRITRATRTMRTTLMTRRIDVFPISPCSFKIGRAIASKSMRLNDTTTMSNMFQEYSFVRKNSQKPSEHQRIANSVEKATLKSTCTTMISGGSRMSSASSLPASSIARVALNCVCVPKKIALAAIRKPVSTSKIRLVVIRCSMFMLASASSRLLWMRKLFARVPFFFNFRDLANLPSRCFSPPLVTSAMAVAALLPVEPCRVLPPLPLLAVASVLKTGTTLCVFLCSPPALPPPCPPPPPPWSPPCSEAPGQAKVSWR